MRKLALGLIQIVVRILWAAALGLLMAVPLSWLWNYGAHGGLGLPALDVLHMWAVAVLCSWLLKPIVKL